MKLFCGNRLETLVDELSTVLRHPLADPFQPEVIIVQSRGMARWLTQQLAARHHVCANYKFPFPKIFAHDVFRALQSDLVEDSPYEPEFLQWRIMGLLPKFAGAPEFRPIQHYLEGDDKALRTYQLAQRIAHVFDQYIVYRPEMILEWDAGKVDHWQGVLWRELTREISVPHAAQLQRRALKLLSQQKLALPGISSRISFFGISALPEFYVQLFEALGNHREVNFFVVQPTKEEWSGIASRREIARTVSRAGGRLTQQELHLDEGHPLLASWGTLGRDFFRSLLNNASFEGSDVELFQPANSNSMLHCLQNDVLDLRHSANKHVIARTDDSIQIHSCHTPLRELEVLYDHMLRWFRRDPQLRPRDIVVMMPDVEAYTPFIQAVFDVPEEKKRRIPFSIADRAAKDESHIADTLLKIFELADSRCGARAVFSILECRSVQQQFELTEAEVELIKGWLDKAGIRWGIDGNHRASFDLPALPHFSWEYGLERLLLGYAMSGHRENTFNDLLPCDEIEGSVASTLGKLIEFTNRLFALRTELNEPRSLHEWNELLMRVGNTFFHSNLETESELQFLRENLGMLATHQELSGFTDAIGLSVMRSHLQTVLQNDNFGTGFLNGGVTFCGLKPLRSLPFKVVCLIGMNDSEFPRQSGNIGFDLMQQSPKPGDPSARNDDQFLFLEALLSAREKIYISHVGQSTKDNKSIPPSVLVSELVDYLKSSFKFRDAELADEDLCAKQRLQAFSAEYFKRGRLFTYSKANAAAFVASKQRVPAAPLLAQPLSEPTEPEWRNVSLRDLADFFCNPAKFFVQKRLNIKLSEVPEGLDEAEPFIVDGRDSYTIKQDMVEKQLEGAPVDGLNAALRCSGELPLGHVGELAYRDLSREVVAFTTALKPILPGTAPQLVSIHSEIGSFSVAGDLKTTSAGLFAYRCAKIKATDLIRAWINHLALNFAKPPGIKLQTTVIGTDEHWTFAPIAESEELLVGLLGLYWAGLSQPLKLFPRCSFAYASAVDRKKEFPLNDAEKEWFTSIFARGEEEDVWFRFCFRHSDPLDENFVKLSCQFFAPLFKYADGVPCK